MRSFQEQLEKDFDRVFFNTEEFGEIHDIDGEKVPIVVDNETLLELNLGKTADSDGIFQDNRMFFIQKKHMPNHPVIGQVMEFDGEMYQVGNVLEDFGGYTVILRGNMR